jgi:hypothetical protein
MATAPQTYPKISKKNWWLLRDRFKKSVPSAVTPTFIHSVSPMTDASARANVILPLRELGLLDDTDKPTPLAERWRHDDEYAAVCLEIRTAIYPIELVEAFPDPDPSRRDAIKSWFMKVGHVGESAARMYADTYLLLSEADPSKSEAKTSPSTSASAGNRAKATPPPKARPAAAKAAAAARPASASTNTPEQDPHPQHRRLPAIHIDVQVHIAPDTPPEQIDRIFESMAKHLGGFVK